ncbi:MAG TPA: sialidase family protein, partial [Chitinophagaceae bacterium]|nr:sialidase family protein [Chitinophagaceae bacterium]
MPVILRFSIFLSFIIPICASFSGQPEAPVRFIGYGNMPSVAVGQDGKVYVVFGRKDSIFLTYSSNQGQSFSTPSLITELPRMYSFAMRGPQVASTNRGLVITAITQAGNIYSLTSPDGISWSKPARVNDTDSSAPEGLMSISAHRNNVFAVWLDIRGNRRNKIYGSSSVDGGVSWQPNKLIYQSPDSTVCECCKPSVMMRGDRVYVMFRNWLEQNRDLYLMHSIDRGKSFSSAAKLGTGSWKLNGCPMDGGGIDMNGKGDVQTVWRRESKIYTAIPGRTESEIGEGKSCVMVSLQNKNIYAWVHKGDIVIRRSDGQLIKPGKGASPVLKKLDPNTAICVWENENQIEAAVFAL